MSQIERVPLVSAVMGLAPLVRAMAQGSSVFQPLLVAMGLGAPDRR